MYGYLTTAYGRAWSYAGDIAWGPLVDLSRTATTSLLDSITIGQLVIIEEGREPRVCGPHNVNVGSRPAPVTTLTVKKSAFWLRLGLFADMGFAESFMLGEVDCPDLTAFFRIFILNRNHLSNGSTLTSSISGAISGLLSRANTLANARLNANAHYDISNEMFAAFLSPDMTYSCPIWRSQTKGSKTVTESESLEEAQMRKLDHFIDKARIKATDRVLEIGTGWGSLAIRAVQRTGCRVTSLTLSREQKILAEQRIAQAGLSDRIEVLLCDYRALPKPRDGPFDKLVSIEMLEAVGREFLATYFQCVDNLLKKDGGIAVFQSTTIPEARYEAYSRSQDFIRKYIFPGGHLPSVTQLVNSIHQGSKGNLIVSNIEDIGPHYARTLRIWKENFLDNFDSRIRPALIKEQREMTEADVAVFRRKWEYYFTYCEAAFNTKTLGVHIITVGREGALEMLEGVPL